MADQGGNPPPRRTIPWHWATRGLGVAGFVFTGALLAGGRDATELGLWIGACLCLLGFGERVRIDQLLGRRDSDDRP